MPTPLTTRHPASRALRSNSVSSGFGTMSTTTRSSRRSAAAIGRHPPTSGHIPSGVVFTSMSLSRNASLRGPCSSARQMHSAPPLITSLRSSSRDTGFRAASRTLATPSDTRAPRMARADPPEPASSTFFRFSATSASARERTNPVPSVEEPTIRPFSFVRVFTPPADRADSSSASHRTGSASLCGIVAFSPRIPSPRIPATASESRFGSTRNAR